MTFIKDPPKTFEELRAEAAAKWQRHLDNLVTKFKAQADALAKMPDVLARPDAMQKWTPDPLNIQCPCGGTDFFVTRYVTIDGIKYRFEGGCASCNQVHTYDWGAKEWIN